jgi:hypothetical protein
MTRKSEGGAADGRGRAAPRLPPGRIVEDTVVAPRAPWSARPAAGQVLRLTLGLLVWLVAGLAPGLVTADGLPPGAYRVSVHIALPNVETRDYDFATIICWHGTDDPEMPLGPLGPGPLAGCPSEARETPEGIAVTTVCPGANAGFAKARYRRTDAGFTGRVDVNLGGKNMTLAEEQRAIKIGKCG